MIFRPLGNFVARFWPVLPLAWIGLLVLVTAVAPKWQDVIKDGDFAYLPENSPSRVGETVFAGAFSENFWGSNIMIVARRDSSPDSKLTDDDRDFIENVLAPRLKSLLVEKGWMRPEGAQPEAGDDGETASEDKSASDETRDERYLVAKVSTAATDREAGPLLDSRDGRATLVRVSLNSEYVARQNAPIIDAVHDLIDPDKGVLRREIHKRVDPGTGAVIQRGMIPPGLDLYLSGPAVVGKDMRDAAEKSGKATEGATVLLVIGLLILIYRAPVLALIPLVTVFVGVKIAMGMLALLAKMGAVTLFNGSETYVTVVMYGAGVDYCMFLMARYKEELDAGEGFGEAIAGTIAKIGAALVASAGTTIVGIGMMVFAEFGKFRQAGLAMSFSLIWVLLAALTFTPALLRMFGKWAFWPKVARERLAAAPGWISPTRFASRLLGHRRLRNFWHDLAASIERKPGAWWLGSTAAMLPLAVVGVLFFDRLTYGLLEELPQDTLSVQGAKAVQEHFPAGEAGPVAVLVESPAVSFMEQGGAVAAGELIDRLWEHRDDLSIADVRGQTAPFGILRRAEQTVVQRAMISRVARKYYVSDTGPEKDHITRVDVVFKDDPFSKNSLAQLDRLERKVREFLPAALKGSKLYLIGPTASIRDLKSVTHSDQIRIDLMVLAGVYAVLMALLRQIMVAAYLIVTVFFSYLVTLGATFATFWAIHPGDFVGLDWKVPMFLFTILVAVGEDYNIFLVARIEEEQRRLGGVHGIREALARTGGIISGCGVIMAGTFCSLMFGSLTGMIQLGFALAFGVILDTFVVRPILVPAYLVMLNDGRFGSASRWLGAYQPPEEEPALDPAVAEGLAGELAGAGDRGTSLKAPPAA
jgi:RND superfamily putative drug exporter